MSWPLSRFGISPSELIPKSRHEESRSSLPDLDAANIFAELSMLTIMCIGVGKPDKSE